MSELRRKLSRLNGAGVAPPSTSPSLLSEPEVSPPNGERPLPVTPLADSGLAPSTAGALQNAVNGVPAEPEGLVPVEASAEASPRPEPGSASVLKSRLQRLSARVAHAGVPQPSPPPVSRSDLLGESVETPHGPLHRIFTQLPRGHRHGDVPLHEAPDVASRTVARLALDESLEGVELSGMLLLDTETTGLAGGTGTLPFLVGFGWFEQGALCVEQLLLRRPGEELPILQRLAEKLRSATCIVTYNGKSYDLPLLRTRFILNRLKLPPPPPHLDLVHAARRLFRNRLREVRLTELEHHVLGYRRTGDIPGAEIPARYFAFLRGAAPYTLNPIIEHNLHDLAALGSALVAMARLLEGRQPDAPATDLLSAAHVALRAGAFEEARGLASGVAARSTTAVEKREAHHLLARLALTSRAWQQASFHLHEAIATGGNPRELAPLHLALAKLYEHQLRDPARALRHAERGASAEAGGEATRRTTRLQRRLERKTTRSASLPLLEPG